MSTHLIYDIGYKARVKVFGPNGDCQQLEKQQTARRTLGDIYECHRNATNCLTNIVWVAAFAHLLLPYYDYFLCDGTHGFAKYGWKFMPVCIVTSAGWIIPIGAVFGLEEDGHALKLLHDAIGTHCLSNSVECSEFGPPTLKPAIISSPHPQSHARMEWAKINLRTSLYPPEWEDFLVLLEMKAWQQVAEELIAETCDSCGDSGHNRRWCPRRERDPATPVSFKAADDQHAINYFAMLMSPFIDADIDAAKKAAEIAYAARPPTLHTDGGSAFGPLCRHIDRCRTSCSKHMEAKVAGVNDNIKDQVTRLELVCVFVCGVVCAW